MADLNRILVSLENDNQVAAAKAANGQANALVKKIEALERSDRIDPTLADELLAKLNAFWELL